MTTNFNFSQTPDNNEPEKKLAIKRLPSWMQSSEQIQKYFDDVIQHWFTPEQQSPLDGYIGQRGGVNTDDKVYVSERDITRQEYQLSPTMVSTDSTNSVLAALTYPDLVSNLAFNGSLVENASRLFSGRFYAWTPPVNPDMVINFSNYYWDSENKQGIIKPDYIVMQRGSIDGNPWSRGNYWYPISYKDENGNVVTLDNADISSGRFVQAERPIIEYVKNLELMNYGRTFRGEVDLICDDLLPSDIMFKRVRDNVTIDGLRIKSGMRVLFTNITNPGENNRIYKITTNYQDADPSTGKPATLVYGLTLDTSEQNKLRPSGEPILGDTIQIKDGLKNRGIMYFWDGKYWVQGQQKKGRHQFPLFKLYDKSGTPLNDAKKYPQSTFKGSSVFTIKIDTVYPEDNIYEFSAVVDKNGNNIYVNNIQTDKFSYVLDNKTVDMDLMRFVSIMKDHDPVNDERFSDWREVSVPTRQYVKQVIDPIVTRDIVDPTIEVVSKVYQLAMEVDNEVNPTYPPIKIDVSGENLNSTDFSVTGKTLTINKELLSTDIITVFIYNRTETPDTSMAAYEIPTSLKNNALNESISEVKESELADHFIDIISNQTGLVGSANGTNNYGDTERVMERGRKIVQHDASLVPLMVHNTNKNVDIINSCSFVRNSYNTFKNKFANKLKDMDTNGQLHDLTDSMVVAEILKAINVGKSDEFAFWLSGMGKTTDIQQTFIPPTPQFIGIFTPTKPEVKVLKDLGFGSKLYNVSHTGALSVSNSYIDDITGLVVNSRLDNIWLELENMIYESINDSFRRDKDDYVPALSVHNVRPSLFKTVNDYTREEWDKLALRSFSQWAISNNVDFRTNSFYDSSDWKTWNYSTCTYSLGGATARGNWKAIHIDYFGTYEINTKPWKLLGFENKPSWWDREYIGHTVEEPHKPSKYFDPAIWADIETGTIRDGIRKGTHAEFARPGFSTYNPVDDTGEIVAPHLSVSGRTSLVTFEPNSNDKGADWVFGDLGDVEFVFSQSNYYSFELAMTLYRAKPAQFANYFWAPAEYELTTQGKLKQWLSKVTDTRLSFGDDSFVHGEGNRSLLGYSMWVSDFLKHNNIDITKNYGNIVRGAMVKLSYRLGGFTKKQNLTFVSDSFGLVSQENQHVNLLKSSIKRQEVISGLKIVYSRNGYYVSGYDSSYPYLKYLKPAKNNKKNQIKIGNLLMVQDSVYSDEIGEVKYDTKFNSIQDMYNFIVSYGEYLESRGWIFEELDQNGEIFDWRQMGAKFAEWANGKRKGGDFIDLSPATSMLKFATEHGNIESVTQFSGGAWSLIDSNYQGIGEHEIDVARIGNIITVRLAEDVQKRIMLLRVNVSEFEHMVTFDNQTIFNDVIFLPKFGLHQLRLKAYGNITSNWNGRLEAPGFMVVGNDTLPNFEKLVNDFERYYDSENPSTSVDLNNLARHFIGFQSREYLRRLILNERNQLDFYKGYIKEKGTLQSFDKILRTSKNLRSPNYKVMEEWAFKVAEYGSIENNSRLEFNVINGEMKQEPQMFRFDNTATFDNPYDSTIIFYGKDGVDPRWVTRSSEDIKFPMVKASTVYVNTPDTGPFNTEEFDIICRDFQDIPVKKAAYTAKYGAQPKSALVVNYNGTWAVFDFVRLNVKVLGVYPDAASSNVVCASSLNLTTDDAFYFDFEDTTGNIDPALQVPRMYYPATGLDLSTVRVNVVSPLVEYNTPNSSGQVDLSSAPEIYIVKLRYNTESKRNAIRMARDVDVVDIKALDKPVIYNKTSNQTEAYLTLWDPRQGVIPGAADSEIRYKTIFDPAVYNSTNTSLPSWGQDQVGLVWWDTSTALYVDYTQPVRNADGSIDVEASRQYSRDNWGKLLPGGSIDLYEWVKSPVSPLLWDEYIESQKTLNKTEIEWVPSGVARLDNWCEVQEYDYATATSKPMYYFWVSQSYSIPNTPFRTMKLADIQRIISSPSSVQVPWFAPISANEFIISGIDPLITDSDSILQLRFKKNSTLETNTHKEWKLFREGDNYDFDPIIWNSFYDSLVGETKTINNNFVPLLYPANDLGLGDDKTWFKNIKNARREFVDVANLLYAKTNMTANVDLMNNVFNYKESAVNPHERDFFVQSVDGQNMIYILNGDRFKNNDAVTMSTDGTLPAPLTADITVFLEVVPNRTNMFRLKAVSTGTYDTSGITLIDKGFGNHKITRVADQQEIEGLAVDMTKFWSLVDWYAEGYSKNTPYINSPSLVDAENMVLGNSDVVRIIDATGKWTLFVKDYTRDVLIWKTVGRQSSTLALNSKIYDFDNLTDIRSETETRKVLRLLEKTFSGVQSVIIFGLIQYMLTEQKVVDWLFKTSYIHVIGIDKALASKTVSLTDPLNDVISYFNEVKPYRTKIRAAMDQRTSDTDVVKASMNDVGIVPATDANTPMEEYYDEWDKEEVARDFSKIDTNFREYGTTIFFDNTQEKVTKDLLSAEEHHSALKRYMTTFNRDLQVKEVLEIHSCPDTSFNGVYKRIDNITDLSEFTHTDLSLSDDVVPRVKGNKLPVNKQVPMYANNDNSKFIFKVVGLGWVITSKESTRTDWYYENVSAYSRSVFEAYNVASWVSAGKQRLAKRKNLTCFLKVLQVTPETVDNKRAYVLGKFGTDGYSIYKEMEEALFSETNKQILYLNATTPDSEDIPGYSEAAFGEVLDNVMVFTNQSIPYFDPVKLSTELKKNGLKNETSIMKIIKAGSAPLKALMDYMVLANRLHLDNPDYSMDYIESVVNGGFKGRQVSNNPIVRMPFGYGPGVSTITTRFIPETTVDFVTGNDSRSFKFKDADGSDNMMFKVKGVDITATGSDRINFKEVKFVDSVNNSLVRAEIDEYGTLKERIDPSTGFPYQTARPPISTTSGDLETLRRSKACFFSYDDGIWYFNLNMDHPYISDLSRNIWPVDGTTNTPGWTLELKYTMCIFDATGTKIDEVPKSFLISYDGETALSLKPMKSSIQGNVPNYAGTHDYGKFELAVDGAWKYTAYTNAPIFDKIKDPANREPFIVTKMVKTTKDKFSTINIAIVHNIDKYNSSAIPESFSVIDLDTTDTTASVEGVVSVDTIQDGYYMWSDLLYKDMMEKLKYKGMSDYEANAELIRMGFAEVVPYLPYIGSDYEAGVVTKSLRIAHPRGYDFNDVIMDVDNPLVVEDLPLNKEGYALDINAYDSLGYEKTTRSVTYENVLDKKYVFDISELGVRDPRLSKFRVTIANFVPEKDIDMDYGIYNPDLTISPGTQPIHGLDGTINPDSPNKIVDYGEFDTPNRNKYSHDYGTNYGELSTSNHGKYSVEGGFVRDPMNPNNLVISVPRNARFEGSYWRIEDEVFESEDKFSYSFSVIPGFTTASIIKKYSLTELNAQTSAETQIYGRTYDDIGDYVSDKLEYVDVDTSDANDIVEHAVSELVIGPHTLQTGDEVIIFSQDPYGMKPKGAIFDDVNVRYFVEVISENSVALYTLDDKGDRQYVILDFAEIEAELTAKGEFYPYRSPEVFGMFYVNPPAPEQEIVIDALNYDAIYNRYLDGGRLNTGKWTSETTITVPNNYATGDEILLCNIPYSYTIIPDIADGGVANDMKYFVRVISSTGTQSVVSLHGTISDAFTGNNPKSFGPVGSMPVNSPALTAKFDENGNRIPVTVTEYTYDYVDGKGPQKISREKFLSLMSLGDDNINDNLAIINTPVVLTGRDLLFKCSLHKLDFWIVGSTNGTRVKRGVDFGGSTNWHETQNRLSYTTTHKVGTHPMVYGLGKTSTEEPRRGEILDDLPIDIRMNEVMEYAALNPKDVQDVDHGFPRPTVDKGSMREKVRMNLEETISFTVISYSRTYYSDRADDFDDGEVVFDYEAYENMKTKPIYYTNLGSDFNDMRIEEFSDTHAVAMRIEKDFWTGEWKTSLLGNSVKGNDGFYTLDTFRLGEDLWYDSDTVVLMKVEDRPTDSFRLFSSEVAAFSDVNEEFTDKELREFPQSGVISILPGKRKLPASSVEYNDGKSERTSIPEKIKYTSISFEGTGGEITAIRLHGISRGYEQTAENRLFEVDSPDIVTPHIAIIEKATKYEGMARPVFTSGVSREISSGLPKDQYTYSTRSLFQLIPTVGDHTTVTTKIEKGTGVNANKNRMIAEKVLDDAVAYTFVGMPEMHYTSMISGGIELKPLEDMIMNSLGADHANRL